MTFGFIEAEKASFPISRMCRVLGVSQSGFFAWQERPACRRQRQDMVYLAHIRTAFALSNGTYGSPRMRPPISSMRAMRSGGIARHD
jgi:putative transposase